eukprot:1056561-Alexandrium_andersonii.AAC.1
MARSDPPRLAQAQEEAQVPGRSQRIGAKAQTAAHASWGCSEQFAALSCTPLTVRSTFLHA